ncbi:chorismate--pyruvate lyase family protein [Candidatus Protofrankia californiensis]|uniref:chorismate--pyruvate lyase family protein n=1 Tax=Candidatus Protofrankia californiensis TaxID=1839754 RepID=UPI0010419991|nr:DUF98 domain-containing protein [Candidatus Protofrankia californiensis]
MLSSYQGRVSKYNEVIENKIVVGGRWPGTQVGSTPPPVAGFSTTDTATETSSKLGPLEQLVLRGDGLTTTSLEILTGRQITVRIRRQQRFPLTVPGQPSYAADTRGANGDPRFNDLSIYTDLDTCTDIGLHDLDGETGDDLLVREVLLTGDNGVVYGTASVLAIVNRLPTDVARDLDTEEPIGRLLVRAALPVVRELQSWGQLPAGDFAAHLGSDLSPESRVPARTYRMRDMLTGHPLTLITERFAPRLFGHAPG